MNMSSKLVPSLIAIAAVGAVMMIVDSADGGNRVEANDRTTVQPIATPAVVEPADDDLGVDSSLMTDDITRAAFEITWSTTPAASKDSMCEATSVFGKGWAREQLAGAPGANDSAEMNWDLMVDLMVEKCTAEGR